MEFDVSSCTFSIRIISNNNNNTKESVNQTQAQKLEKAKTTASSPHLAAFRLVRCNELTSPPHLPRSTLSELVRTLLE